MTETRQLTMPVRRRETATDGRTVEVIAVPFGETLELWGGMFREQVSPDVEVVLRDGHPLPMLWRHGEQIGAWQRDLTRDAAGLRATGRISDTATGRDVATLLADEAVGGASIGFNVLRSHSEKRDTGSVDVIDAIELLEISLTPIPAYAGARLQSVREKETHPMTSTPATDLPDLDRLEPRFERLEQSDAQLRDLIASIRDDMETRQAPADPRAGYPTLDAFVAAARSGEIQTRALVDQISPNSPGLMGGGWITEIKGIVDAAGEGVAALGGMRALPADGMAVAFPYFDGDLYSLVGQQNTEKTEITSVRVDIKQGSKGIGTIAGGSDISWQLLMRSSPSYREAYIKIMTAAFAATVDHHP